MHISHCYLPLVSNEVVSFGLRGEEEEEAGDTGGGAAEHRRELMLTFVCYHSQFEGLQHNVNCSVRTNNCTVA